jgi:hypothetical protein
MCLWTQPKGGPVTDKGFRRRDADGGGRDDRAPEGIARIRLRWGGSTELANVPPPAGPEHGTSSPPPAPGLRRAGRPSPPQVCGGEGEEARSPEAGRIRACAAGATGQAGRKGGVWEPNPPLKRECRGRRAFGGTPNAAGETPALPKHPRFGGSMSSV